jgi:hypothetical protein
LGVVCGVWVGLNCWLLGQFRNGAIVVEFVIGHIIVVCERLLPMLMLMLRLLIHVACIVLRLLGLLIHVACIVDVVFVGPIDR